MATIINIFSKEVLSVHNDSVCLSPPKGFLKEVDDSLPNDWYAGIRERLEARFGDNLPPHFSKCMAKPQKQPYRHGDCHNVSYRGRSPKFNSPMPVPCQVTAKSCRRVNGVLVLGLNCERGVDEPFPWVDAKYRVTLNFLKSLPDNTELLIYTRSDLVATEAYVSELKRLNCTVNILYHTEIESVCRQSEPGAPSYARRNEAVSVLLECGIRASMVRHDIPKVSQSA